MIKTKEDLNRYIEADRARYNYKRYDYLRGRLLCSEKSHAIRLLYYLRMCEYYSNTCKRNPLKRLLLAIYYLVYSRLQFKYDTYINLHTCGRGLWMPHLGGIIINCRSMGANCSVTKGVVIGNKKGQDQRAIIGDNCYFTVGSKVIGKVRIGDNVIVCQNSVVIKDVPNNTIVSGIPAKPIRSFNDISEVNI